MHAEPSGIFIIKQLESQSRFQPMANSLHNLNNGWMICDFTYFSTAFQSYQDDVRMIIKAVCNGTPFTVEKI